MAAGEALAHCTLCPHACGTNRLSGEKGACGMDARLRIARAALHFWEEPCISGTAGSGAVFFSGCPLHCVYCQNAEISEGRAGAVVSTRRLADIFLELQEKGAVNINLVTPTQYAVQIREALCDADKRGLSIPIVYNCGGYESVQALRMIESSINIYLTDFKYMDRKLAGRFSHAEDYPLCAREALKEMVRQKAEAVFDETGMMKRGVIVRHLLLPGCLEDSKQVVRYLYETYGNDIYISLMRQYTPVHAENLPEELRRTVYTEEYEELVDYALALGVENGFLQEEGTASESFIPPFDLTGVLEKTRR